jgi:hypothetical protein
MRLAVGSLVRKGVALGLMFEAFRSVSWIARILSLAAIYDAPVFVMVALRGAVTALQAVAGLRLWQQAPVGGRLAELGFLSSAVLLVFEVGFVLAPSSIFPDLRWYVVGGYALYAVVATLVLRFTDPAK